MTTLMGKSGFDETHPLSAGVAGYSESPVMRHFLETADTILVVKEPEPDELHAGDPRGQGADPRHQRPTRPVQDVRHGRRGPRRRELFLAALRNELAGRGRAAGTAGRDGGDDRTAARMAGRVRAVVRRGGHADPPGTGCSVSCGRCSTRTRRSSPTSRGISRDIQSVFWRARTPRSYLAWGHSTQLGFSLGLAMGAKLAHPDKIVVNVMGDAVRGTTGMDWETASWRASRSSP